MRRYVGRPLEYRLEWYTSLEPLFISEYFARRSCVPIWWNLFQVISVYLEVPHWKKRQNGKRVVFCSVLWSGPCWPILLIHIPKCLGDNGFQTVTSSVAIMWDVSLKLVQKSQTRSESTIPKFVKFALLATPLGLQYRLKWYTIGTAEYSTGRSNAPIWNRF